MLKWSKSAFQTRGISYCYSFCWNSLSRHLEDAGTTGKSPCQDDGPHRCECGIRSRCWGLSFPGLHGSPRTPGETTTKTAGLTLLTPGSRIQIPWILGTPMATNNRTDDIFAGRLNDLFDLLVFSQLLNQTTHFAGEDLSELSVHIEKTSTMKSLNK